MNRLEPSSNSTPVHRVNARNISINSENAIHNDEGARALGFAGGLVSGVTVYGYMTVPLVKRYGEAWLENHTAHASFFQPVYDGEPLAIRTEAPPGGSDSGAVRVVAARAQGEDVAVLDSAMPSATRQAPSRAEPISANPVPPPPGERPDFDWALVKVGEPFRPLMTAPDMAVHQTWCDQIEEENPIYREGPRPPLHPSWILQQANGTVGNQFRMTPWIHVSSHITTRRAPRVGDSLEIRATPLEKWEKDGNGFVLLHVTMIAGDEVIVDLKHKTILQMARRA